MLEMVSEALQPAQQQAAEAEPAQLVWPAPQPPANWHAT